MSTHAVALTRPLLARMPRLPAPARLAGLALPVALALLPTATAAQKPPPASAQQQAAALPAVFGTWIDDTGKGAVEVLPCEGQIQPGAQPRRLCGRIVWLQDSTDKAGKPLTDGYNPKSALRARPICGLQVIGDAKPMRNGTWDEGWIYDPKEGKSYDVEVRLRGPDRLAVTGYLGLKFLSETFVWTRAPADLPRCDTTTQASRQPTQPPAGGDRQQARR